MKHPAASISILVLLLSAFGVQAQWQVDGSASTVSFVSVKNGAIAEAHHFGEVTGQVSKAGKAEIFINLASVETNIPIRNERMQQMLFETSKFASARVTAQVNTARYEALQAGQSMQDELSAELDLHGVKASLKLPVTVTSAGQGVYTVVSRQPVILQAAGFGLESGIEALREVAGLNGITGMVPVTFNLRLAPR